MAELCLLSMYFKAKSHNIKDVAVAKVETGLNFPTHLLSFR